MEAKELIDGIEYLDNLAEKLTAHMILFDAYYNTEYGAEQIKLDPDTFSASMNDILDKAEHLTVYVGELAKAARKGCDEKAE